MVTFLNLCISVKTSLINSKLGDFVNVGALFLIMWINGWLTHNLETRKVLFSLKSGNFGCLLFLELIKHSLCEARALIGL